MLNLLLLILSTFYSVIDNPEVVLDPLSQASEEFEVLEVSDYQQMSKC